MFAKRSMSLLAAALLAALSPLALFAQQDRHQRGTHVKYKLFDLGTFGGPSSYFSDGNPPLTKISNNRGTSVGAADTAVPDPYAPNCIADCFVAHALRTVNGHTSDLGALPGANTSFASAINEKGWSTGISENGALDPLTGFPETNAILWKGTDIVNLGTFGGSSSIAYGINDRGHIVGGALTATPDPYASAFNYFFVFPIATQARAFLWRDGDMQDLGTLGGPDSVASYINNHGEVAGVSYVNSVPNPASGVPTIDPFLWMPCNETSRDKDDCNDDDGRMAANKGRMTDLGGLGGTSAVVAGLNNHGQVIGQSNLAGDRTHHPFLWDRGHMTDLGTLGGDFGFASYLNESGEIVGTASLPIPCPGCGEGPQIYHAFFWKQGIMTDLGTFDKCSLGNGINSKGQIVGASGLCGVAKHAFLSESGAPIIDLNTLIASNSGLTLTGAIYINDRGEIAGFGLRPNGDEHAYVLMPCDRDHPDVEGCDYDPASLDVLAGSAKANDPSSQTGLEGHTSTSQFAHKRQK